MKSFVIRLVTFGIALFITGQLIEGIFFDNIGAIIGAAVVLSIVNALIRPVLLLLTLPLSILTLGLFSFVINGFMLKITAFLVPGMEVAGFWVAVLGALVLAIINSVLNFLVGSA